jgi:hypothetical protein
MRVREFNALAKQLFGETLGAYGFSHEGSRTAVFHRWNGPDVVHIIYPDLMLRNPTFDVRVFPTSPACDPMFREKFPDRLGATTDSYSYLSSKGVGPFQQIFRGRTEEGFRRNFEREVKPALETLAVPYLDQFCSLSDLIPVLRNKLSLGFALHAVGRHQDAREVLAVERTRLLPNAKIYPEVEATVRIIDDILAEK